jgi:hypothetical protein
MTTALSLSRLATRYSRPHPPGLPVPARPFPVPGRVARQLAADVVLPRGWVDLAVLKEFHSGPMFDGQVQTPRRLRFTLAREIIWC